MRHLFAFLLFLLTLGAVPYEATAQEHAPLVVMNLAAHPDDEDGSTLTYYRKAKNAVAYSVIFTRGEGGQNEIGPELYHELGAIRTRETERAARILGTQVFFLNFYDFGFSKHASEAFEKWGGRDSVTARLVYLIRKLKPDVLFTNHDTLTVGPRRQHGQHQAVGIAAFDAFALAADPSYHPEQLSEPGIDLWQPKRLFLRYWQEPESYDVAVPVGDLYEPAGKPYVDIAMDALREHASQGMGMFADRFRPNATYFALLRSATDAPLDPSDLAGNLPPNDAAEPSVSYLIDSGRIPQLPADALTLNDAVAVPGQQVELRWDPDQLPERRLRWVFEGAIDTTLVLSDQTPGIARLLVSPSATPTVPAERFQYDRFLNHPPVLYKLYRPGTQELLAAGYLPLEIAPPVVAAFRDEAVRLQPGRNPLAVEVQVFAPEIRNLPVTLAVANDSSRTVLTQQQQTLTLPENGVFDDTLWVNLPATLPAGNYTVLLNGLARKEQQRDRTRQSPTGHAFSATVPGRVVDVSIPENLAVGVIQSYDDAMVRALRELGAKYVLLDSTALAEARFDGLHTIIVDIRAYLVRPDLRRYNDRLLDWVHRGGHLVVNYQKTFEWNPDASDPFLKDKTNPPDLAPYPILLGRERVTREEAPIDLLVPDHALFNAPNVISPADWDGWVQERGLYFPIEYDSRYQELLATNDPGEEPLKSGILLARHGDGTYLYTPLVWYRQLKQHHPGAYRMFANMLSLPLTEAAGTQTSSRQPEG